MVVMYSYMSNVMAEWEPCKNSVIFGIAVEYA